MTESVNLRAIVLDVLGEILDNGKYSHIVLNQALLKYQYLEKQERSFIMRVVLGTVENRMYLGYVINRFSKTKTDRMKPVIRNIMLMSVYQILYMEQVPDSAAVNEAVKLVGKRGLSGLKGFVNGVLRTVSREGKNLKIEGDTAFCMSIRYSMPQWIVEEWLLRYGEQKTVAILAAFLEEKKTYIRCDKKPRELIKEKLKESKIVAEDAPYIEYALCLSGYNYLGAVTEFAAGEFSVQDISSMLVGVVAAPWADQTVVDVCAAPGGKTTHIAGLLNGTGTVISRDLSEEKTALIRENVGRLGLKNVKIEVHDALVFDESLEEKADILICDLPCSGLGIIGRKPDIKYRMTRQQLVELADLQRRILSTVWRYVKPGGRLLYSTCTIDRMENEENTAWILKNLPFEEEDIGDRLPQELAGERISKGSIQLLPGIHRTDGFYIAAMIRK